MLKISSGPTGVVCDIMQDWLYSQLFNLVPQLVNALLLQFGYKLCRPDVSLGVLFSCLGNLNSRRRNLRQASTRRCANFLTTNCTLKLPENELAIVLATKETSLTNSKAVRRMIHVLPTL